MRFLSACLAFWLLITAALADPKVPEIAASAAAYRDEIAALKVESTAPQILRGIRQAEEAKDKARLVKLYEQLVALNGTNFRAWLHLAQAWRELEPTADKGLSAAFNAYTDARPGPDQLEALLFMASVMRKRLELFGEQHAAAQSEVQKLKNVQDYSDNAESEREVPIRDRTDPLGSAKLLEKSQQAADLIVRQVTEQIIQVVAELDEVYREIAKRLPALKLDDMRSKDFRSRVFETKLGNDGKPRVDFQTQKGDVHACVFFTQDLKAEDGLSYRKFLDVAPQTSGDSSDGDKTPTSDNKAPSFGVDTAGGRGRLCITNLRPGGVYNITLKAGLPSKQGGSLAEAVEINDVTLPDLPGQIAFSGKHFVLPKTGDGEVPLFITNIDTFGLELLRITDRTLHRHVALGNIGGELRQSDYDDIRGQFGERMWSAAVKVKEDASKSNETLRTYLPVRRILKARQEALARRVADDSGNTERCLLPVELSGVKGLTIRGRDCADTASFEREALKRPMRGVFALVTRDTIKLSKADKASNTSDVSDGTDDSGPPPSLNEKERYLVQWFLDTDIGLSFYEGVTEFSVVARSLGSGEAKRGIRIELVSANNRVLAAGQTDSNGMAKFPRGLTRGDQGNKLVAVLAYSDADDDFGFVTVGNERLNLARLNVDGRTVGDRLSAFLTTDRGIYEPGEKINLTAIVRDSKGRAPDGPFKATIRLEARDRVFQPDTVEARDWKLGGMTRQIELPRTVRHGAVRIVLARGSSESAPVLGETLVQIGPVRPDRARLTFADRGWEVRKTTPDLVKIKGTVSAQYLYGTVGHAHAAAGELRVEGQIKVGASESPADACYDNFAFGGTDDQPTMTSIRQFVDHTDKDGKLNIDRIGAGPSSSTRPLAASLELTLFDATGPLASASKSFPIANDKGWIGISKIPRLRQSARAGTFDLDIDLVSITSDNQPEQDRELDVQLQREQDVYVWQRGAENWQHIKSVRRVDVTKSKLSTARLRRLGLAPDGNCVRAIEAPGLARSLDVGRYVLTLTDPRNNRSSSVRFNVGSVTTDSNQLEPNIFALSTDKPTYRVGETIKISPKVSFDGPALVAIADSDVQHWEPGAANKDIEVQARPEWEGKGMYALATAFRAQADGTMNTGPGRAIGATYFEVVGSRSGYDVAVDVIGTSGQPLVGHPAINPNEPSQLRRAGPGNLHRTLSGVQWTLAAGWLSDLSGINWGLAVQDDGC